MTDREKLIELLWEYDQLRIMRMSIEECADRLIPKGLTVRKCENDTKCTDFDVGGSKMVDIKEKMIELLDEIPELILSADMYGVIADHLIANGVTVQKWIPVTERLPDKDDRYATVCDFGNGAVSRGVLAFAKDFSNVVTYQTTAKDIWYEYDREYGFVMITYVTHWMPLPEAPKEVE